MTALNILLVASLITVSAATEYPPIYNGLGEVYQSTGSECVRFTLDKCTPCGNLYYQCSVDVETGFLLCWSSTEYSCTNVSSSVPVKEGCTSNVCEISLLPKYQYEVAAASGIGLMHPRRWNNIDLDTHASAVKLGPTSVTIVAYDFSGIMVTSNASSGFVGFEQGVYNDGTFLTSAGVCAVGEWCDAFEDLTYRLSLIESISNDTTPVLDADVDGDFVIFDIDNAFILRATSDVRLFFTDSVNDVGVDVGSFSALSLTHGLSNAVWSDFLVKELGEESEIVFKVTTARDFPVYREASCDNEWQGLPRCAFSLDVKFDMEDLWSFVHQLSISFTDALLLERAYDAPATNWEEQEQFKLWE